MSSKDTRQFMKRKARVEQAIKGQRKNWMENYAGISTINTLISDTGLNEQAVKRIIKNLEVEGKVKVIEDKSHIVLLK